MAYGCTLATCGVAGGPAIKTTVYPFIIRGGRRKLGQWGQKGLATTAQSDFHIQVCVCNCNQGVKLYGVDSVFASTEDRKLVWSDLAKVPSEASPLPTGQLSLRVYL